MKKYILFIFLLSLSNGLFGNFNRTRGYDLYLSEYDIIGGWYEKPFLAILDHLDSTQQIFKISGNLAEIGTYHGKSFISLYHLAKNGELALAVDCFDDQQYNYDLSGMGAQFKPFKDNMQRYCDVDFKNLKSTKLRVLIGDSSKMKAVNYLKSCNNKKFRIFSIDGCHTGPVTLIDLRNASNALQPGGIIIIDDYFNKDWPGVSAGVSEFMFRHPGKLVPFFVGYNKVLFTQPEWAPKYIKQLKSKFNPKKDSYLFNSDVVIFE